MPLQNIMISKMLHGMKGDNSFQIIKNMATIIGRDTNLSAIATHQKLDDLLTEIQEKLDELEDYKKVKQRLKDYKFGVWYDIPKNDRRMFRIDQVNPEGLKVMFSYGDKGSLNKIEKVGMNIDNFMLFLHHPELF